MGNVHRLTIPPITSKLAMTERRKSNAGWRSSA